MSRRTTTLSALALLATSASSMFAQAAPSAPPPIAQQIAAAVQPLPKELRDGATVMGYKTGTKLEVIRPGKNGMRCLALYVTRPDFHVACYHDGMEPFMARGRELRYNGVTGAKVDSVRFAEVASGKLKMPAHATLYSITGKKETFDAATGKITGASQLTVLYMPGATGESTGISTVPVATGPWMMFPGTPKAHLMISGSMSP